MIKKTSTKEHPLTTFRKNFETRSKTVMSSLKKAQDGIAVNDEMSDDLINKSGSTGGYKNPMKKDNFWLNDTKKFLKEAAGADSIRLPGNFNVNIANQNKLAEMQKSIPLVQKPHRVKTEEIHKKGGPVKYKTGGAAKATKFAALAKPFNKVTFADKIAGAKMNNKKIKSADSIKKVLPKAKFGNTTGDVKPTYSRKFQVGTDKDYSGKDQYSNAYEKIYKTTSDGKIVSRSSASQRANTIGGDNVTSYPKNTTVIDTTGYSKGKKSFPAKKSTYNIAEINYDNIGQPGAKPGRSKYSEWDVPRKDVKKTIAQMKSNSGANKSKGTNVNYNSAGTKTVVHTGADNTKYVKVTDKDGKTFNKVIKQKTGGTVKTKKK